MARGLARPYSADIDHDLRGSVMKSRYLIVALALALAAGAAAAALSRGNAEPATQTAQPCMEQPGAEGIARVVITATREIPRVVVMGHRPAAALAANTP
jgi:hypothetical protein